MRKSLALRVLSWIVLLQRYCHCDNNGNNGQTPDPFPSFSETSRMSIANMTCKFFAQPLNHFVPRGKSPNYRQRYCYYSGFATRTITSLIHGRQDRAIDASSSSAPAPIFFYTGNESPLEQYINHTGLMWELAPIFHAHVVFVEHRYEGQSLPPANLSRDCLSYASTIQALADYATILKDELIPLLSGTRSSGGSSSGTPLLPPPPPPPVIAFGGSYGGMLSAWFRFKYPHIVTGAIAASAPIGAFPQAANHKIDASAQVISRGMDLPYPPDQDTTTSFALHPKTKNKQGTNHCRSNLLAAWPLLTYLVRQTEYQTMVQDALRLCTRPESTPAFISQLLDWGQSIWFDLAEGSFPYPSTYIPFALLHQNIALPAWPLQAACWNTSQLHHDWGVRFSPRVSGSECNSDDDGDDYETLKMSPPLSCVQYDITYGASGLTLHIDWSNVTVATTATQATIHGNTDLIALITSVRDAVSIWYNITQDVSCYNVSMAAPNLENGIYDSWNGNQHGIPKKRGIRRFRKPHIPKVETLHPSSKDVVSHVETVVATSTESGERALKAQNTVEPTDDPAQVCRAEIQQGGSWGPLCCNDDINLVITNARGLGQDFFWPPSHPRGTETYADTVRNVTGESCPDPDGIFGYSTEPYDPWSSWMDATYGSDFLDSSCLEGHSNIIFSNGLLDPWSAGGVYAAGMDPTTSRRQKKNNAEGDVASVQNITDRDLIALVIPLGGHHTDLMYSNPERDPKCVKEARRIERDYIAKWVEQWNRDQERRRVDSER
jgi:lysosomal Pro-X carboxypeptidase